MELISGDDGRDSEIPSFSFEVVVPLDECLCCTLPVIPRLLPFLSLAFLQCSAGALCGGSDGQRCRKNVQRKPKKILLRRWVPKFARAM